MLESADTFGLESAEATGMPNARTDISGGSAKLEASLKRLGITLVASDATCITPRNTGVASMTTGDSAESMRACAEICGVKICKVICDKGAI